MRELILDIAYPVEQEHESTALITSSGLDHNELKKANGTFMPVPEYRQDG